MVDGRCGAMKVEEYKKLTRKKSKYGNKRVRFEGMTFDSEGEFHRYLDLLMLQRAGIITDLSRQVKFVLIPSQKDENGKTIERECSYVADFTYRENGEFIVEDYKGHKTDVYKLKKKLMLEKYGYRIRETR